MSNQSILAPHEIFQLHELLSFNNICALKASSLSGAVDDPKLRVMLETRLKDSQVHIKDLRNFLQ